MQIKAQFVVSGIIKSTENKTLSSSVVLKDAQGNIVAFSNTGNNGQYKIKFNKIGKYTLSAASLSYSTEEKEIILSENKKEQNFDFELRYNEKEISEVIVTGNRPISIKKDTIIYDVKSFLKGNEQVVEDILKNLPGIDVDRSGKVSYNGKEVENIMIEGDDMFGKTYTTLSKNMPSRPIDKVELYQKYSKNRLLKGIEESEKVALNLKLKEDAKNIWFGKLETSATVATEERYDASINVMNFSKKTKHYFLGNYNNLGYDKSGGESFSYSASAIDDYQLGNYERSNTLISTSNSGLNFSTDKYNFNNQKYLSLNSVFNPSKKLNIKNKGFVQWDKSKFYRNSIDNYFLEENSFTNKEDYKEENPVFKFNEKVDITYNISSDKMLETSTLFNIGEKENNNYLVFNNLNINTFNKTKNVLFNQNITYTHKIGNQQVLVLKTNYKTETSPQNYKDGSFIYQSVFPDYPTTDNQQQKSNDKMQFAGLNAHYYNRLRNNDLFELELGNEFRIDDFYSHYFLKSGTSILANPEDFQNNLSFNTNNLFLNSSYNKQIKKLKLGAKIELHQINNYLKNKTENKVNKQNYFYVNPSLVAQYQINDKNKISANYSLNRTNYGIMNLYSNYALLGFRSFNSGLDNIAQANSSNASLVYSLGNFSDKFFGFINVGYNKNDKYISSRSNISQNFNLTESYMAKNKKSFYVNGQVNKYTNLISSNIKINFGYNQSNYQNYVNSSEERKIVSKNYNYGMEVRSGFSGFFNYHIGTNWMTSEFKQSDYSKAVTNGMSFLDLYFTFGSNFFIKASTELYNFGNMKGKDSYLFSNLISHYSVIKNKFGINFTINNLTNTEIFRTNSISDINSSITQYKLLPRYFLLGFEYSF